MADKMKVLNETMEWVIHELNDINRKDKHDKEDVECTYKMIDIVKDIDTDFAMNEYNPEYDGYSNRGYYPHYYNDVDMMNGNSYRNRNMGRYSMDWGTNNMNMRNGNGYSRESDARKRLEKMMNEGNLTDREREAIRSAIDRM